jgi:hypothetical protein
MATFKIDCCSGVAFLNVSNLELISGGCRLCYLSNSGVRQYPELMDIYCCHFQYSECSLLV